MFGYFAGINPNEIGNKFNSGFSSAAASSNLNNWPELTIPRPVNLSISHLFRSRLFHWATINWMWRLYQFGLHLKTVCVCVFMVSCYNSKWLTSSRIRSRNWPIKFFCAFKNAIKLNGIKTIADLIKTNVSMDFERIHKTKNRKWKNSRKLPGFPLRFFVVIFFPVVGYVWTTWNYARILMLRARFEAHAARKPFIVSISRTILATTPTTASKTIKSTTKRIACFSSHQVLPLKFVLEWK